MGRFVKDVIRTGRFFVPHMGVWLDMDARRMDSLATQFARMSGNGVNVPLTIDHAQTADAVRGRLTRLYREGDTLMMECDVPDAESEALLARCPHVSLELEKSIVDGNGEEYPEALTAVTITSRPVVPDQEPFQKIAASRDGKGKFVLRLNASQGGDERDSVREMTDQAFGPVRLSLLSDPEGGVEAVPGARAQVIVGELLALAADEHGDEAPVADFVYRVTEGDLKGVLWDAIEAKLPNSATNGELKALVVEELRKLWESNPPAPADDLANIFGDSPAAPVSLSIGAAPTNSVANMINAAWPG